MPAIKSKLRAGHKTIREVFEQALTKGGSKTRADEMRLVKREQSPAKDRRHQSINSIHDRHTEKITHKKIAPTHGTEPTLIKYFIAVSFYSPGRIARETGVSRATVSQIINGRGDRSLEVEKFISHITKVKLSELFPNWYPDTSKH